MPQGHTRRCLSVVESREQLEEEEEEEEAEEEKKKEGDGFHDVPLRRSGAFRAHSHNYDPFKRHSWGPGRELQDSLSRNKPQASGCEGPQKDPLQWSQEELDPFLELQHRGGQPSCVEICPSPLLLSSAKAVASWKGAQVPGQAPPCDGPSASSWA